MRDFVQRNVIIICATVIVVWMISAVTVIIVTGNFDSLKSFMTVVSPAISSLAVLLGVSGKVNRVSDEVQSKVEEVHKVISDGDVTEPHP